LGFFHLLA